MKTKQLEDTRLKAVSTINDVDFDAAVEILTRAFRSRLQNCKEELVVDYCKLILLRQTAAEIALEYKTERKETSTFDEDTNEAVWGIEVSNFSLSGDGDEVLAQFRDLGGL